MKQFNILPFCCFFESYKLLLWEDLPYFSIIHMEGTYHPVCKALYTQRTEATGSEIYCLMHTFRRKLQVLGGS